MSNKRIDYFGLNWKRNFPTKENIKAYSEDKIEDESIDLDKENFGEYLSYINDLLQKESSRLATYDTKSAQIVGQTSLTLSIVGLFAPFSFDKVQSSQMWLKIILTVGFILIALFLLYAIICALRNFNIRMFNYAIGDEKNIINGYMKSIKFHKEVINDKIFELKVSRDLNNVKGSNVLYAYRSFKTAIVILVSYILFYSASLFFINRNEQKPIDLSEKSLKQIESILDTTVIKVDIKNRDSYILHLKDNK